jgi:hypothetical protein
VYETSDVVTPEQRYVVTILLPKELDEAPPVVRFLVPHAIEDRCRSWKVVTEAFGKIGIDSLVFFFKRDS